MNLYLLDTNICIELIRWRNANVLRRLSECEAVGISTITLAELQHGVAKSIRTEENKIALSAFCSALEVYAFDDNAASAYGRVRSGLERKGQCIGPLDMLIAAHALALEAVMVTNNERAFRRVERLQVENWI